MTTPIIYAGGYRPGLFPTLSISFHDAPLVFLAMSSEGSERTPGPNGAVRSLVDAGQGPCFVLKWPTTVSWLAWTRIVDAVESSDGLQLLAALHDGIVGRTVQLANEATSELEQLVEAAAGQASLT